MSGDVQPRKRKDKKRKRDEDSVPLSFYPKDLSEDINIHVHKDEGTGGGLCAKIVFFILFSALIVLIGLIITEHRGLTDLDVAESESRYSQIFEGWVDNGKHDEHTLDDHDNEHFDDDENEHGDGHTLDDHDDDHIDDEPSEEQEHTLDDHDDQHFDDDDDTSQTISDEIEEEEEEEEPSNEENETPTIHRYRREMSEEDEEENVTESQPDDETEEEEVMAESETKEYEENESATRETDEDEDLTESQQYSEDDAEENDDEQVSEEAQADVEGQTYSGEVEKEDEDGQSEGKYSESGVDDGNASEEDEEDRSARNTAPGEETQAQEKSKQQPNLEAEAAEDDQNTEATKEDSPDNSATADNPSLFNSRQTDQDDSDSDKLSEDIDEYEYSTITNEDDWIIQKELDEAQKTLPENAAKALKMFEKILEKYPSSPRGLYGLATALDKMAEIKRSNELLEEAVTNYLKISNIQKVPDQLFIAAMERCVDRLRFRGRYGKAVAVHLKLIKRFPDEKKYRNHLVVLYLTMGRDQEARSVLEEILRKWPNDGCALVHYGFIWKTTYNDLKKGIIYMKKGIETNDPCAIDGRFFFHLGDALFRLGYKEEALKLYENGVEHKLFPSKYQRSLYNVPHLTARPWWNEDQLHHYQLLFRDLKKNWRIIRDEGLSVLNENGYFQDESENLRNTGEWKQFELFARGRKHIKNCHKTPTTCRIIENHPFASGCRRGQTKFSVMHPGTHVWAHCGPTNCRLRIHLGLKVPTQTFIRVCDEIRGWEDGELLIFDDSFEHEVWHNGTDKRLVLIVDVWHPELSIRERETLSSL